jgi:hypothetical protein
MLYDLIFTDKRMIAILVYHPNDTLTIGSSFFIRSLFVGNWLLREPNRQDRIAQSRREALKSQSPDEIVAKNPKALTTSYDNVSAVEISQHWFQTQLRFYLSNPGDAVKVRSYTLSSKQIPQARQLLEQVLKSKIKEK